MREDTYLHDDLVFSFLHLSSSVRRIGGCDFDRRDSRCSPATSECSNTIDEAEDGGPNLQDA